MSKYRRAARTDTNQTDIVKELRRLGYSVQPEMDDILVGHNGKTYWFELKSDSALNKNGTYKAGAIKPGQIALRKTWKGHYDIVHSIEQILEVIE